MRLILMENIIKPKRLNFAEEMGLLFKTITKPLDVKSIKQQLVTLTMIKIDPHNVDWIKLRVDMAIKIKPAQDKDFVNDKKLFRELRPDYVYSFSNSLSRLTRSRFSSKRRSRQQVCLKDFVIMTDL